MPRFNRVLLFGAVVKAPEFIEENHEFKVTVKTTIGRRRSYDGEMLPVYEYIKVFAGKEKVLNEIAGWQKNDFVLVDGILCTRYIDKTATCTECGTEVSEKIIQCYVQPIFAERQRHLEEDEIEEVLLSHSTLSNRMELLGAVASEPKLVTLKPKKYEGKPTTFCQYQIALNRLYRVKSDPEDRKADFPYVKSYTNAMEDIYRLRTGTTVFIDGYLQSRTFSKKYFCPTCGTRFQEQHSVMEIVPYHTEYLEYFNKRDREADLYTEKETDEEAV